MIAKVLEVNLKATKVSNGGKTLTGVLIKYQGQPYKGQTKPPTERFLFSNNPVAEELSKGEINVGDSVDIKFDTDTYKTPLSISKGEASQQQSAPTSAKAAPNRHHVVASMSYNERQQVLADLEAEKAVSIAKSVALKAAVDLMGPGNINEVDAVLASARYFEKYLLDVKVDAPQQEKKEKVEEPQSYNPDGDIPF